MERDTWHAHFFDGQTAQRYPVQARVGADDLEVIFSDRPSERWAYGSFRQTEGFYAGEWVKFEKDDGSGQALAIEDVAILTAIRARYPASGFHDPRGSPLPPPARRAVHRVHRPRCLSALRVWVAHVRRWHRAHRARRMGKRARSILCRRTSRPRRIGVATRSYAEVVDEIVARLTAASRSALHLSRLCGG